MLIRHLNFAKRLTAFHQYQKFHIRLLTTTKSNHPHLSNSTTTSPVNPAHLLRVCTVLYQQQNSPESRLHSSLSTCNFNLTHEFFLQEMGQRRLVNDKTFKIALKTLAEVRELKKCVNFFHIMNDCGCDYSLERLNKVVEILCSSKLVVEAKYLVLKLNEWIKPNGITYIWNLMVDEGFISSVDVVDKMIETFFKINKYEQAMKVFQMMRVKRMDELGLSTYRLVINWMCKRGKISQAYVMFEEMLKRGIEADNLTLSYVIYGLLARGKVREAYKVVGAVEKSDISVYHGLIKGLLKLRRGSEATQVFREMIKRGWHLGKRGRKGVDP
ncbi:hypothetical protein Patl1_16724 [Pistacia atlantica]|uniref:Uncharacterized protein n=1 Tax=Pistacia atlantica TaxID=434234 RepID=A0ACC1B815_9ROSI|nr:hypothetical protein Patl1_16724 [Pistacia atlantica]